MKKIMRVFPRRTNATPDDEMVRIAEPPGLFDECDEIHISVCWSWDLRLAEWLEREWKHVAPVKIGGPATGERSESFTPGMYIKHGYTITSRGCPNRCWFCSVWKREGSQTRELPIHSGWNILDDNLLACSDNHIKAVFGMLEKQQRQPEFTGGIEAKRLLPWHAEAMKRIKTKQLFCAYDTPDDLEPLRAAGKIFLEAGFTTASHALRCYVLCGWKGDTFEAADKRMKETQEAGFTPMAMLFRDGKGDRTWEWRKFQRAWARPSIIHAS